MDASPWPIWDLVVRTERLELRPVREADAIELVELAERGIHDPATMPFLTPFTDLAPTERVRTSMQFYARWLADWSADAWILPLVARERGRCVGLQSVEATEFPVRRTVVTGSWLGLDHHGRGLGTEMRRGVLALAFDALGAVRAETSAFEDNAASLAVTRSVGYRPDGWRWAARRGERSRVLRYAMDREDWTTPGRVQVGGITPDLLDQFGLSTAG